MSEYNNKITLSIIVPVYNTDKYLEKCLNSLLIQRLNGIEIIVVNDGSPDGSQSIINGYVWKNPGKVRSFLKNNGGLGSARNFGIEQAKGEYIGFIDSDDYVRPDMFEKLFNKAKEENADLVICNMDFVNESDKRLSTTDVAVKKDRALPPKQYAMKYGRNEAVNKLYHRDLFLKTGIRYPKGWFEDYPTTPLLIQAANNISYVEDSLMCYVQRKGSIMDQATHFSDRYFDILEMTNIIVQNKNRFAPEDYAFFLDNIAPVHAFLKYYMSILLIQNYKKRKRVVIGWCDKLNELLPGWHKSSAVRNVLKRKSWIRKGLLKFLIYCFRLKIILPAAIVARIYSAYRQKNLYYKIGV